MSDKAWPRVVTQMIEREMEHQVERAKRSTRLFQLMQLDRVRKETEEAVQGFIKDWMEGLETEEIGRLFVTVRKDLFCDLLGGQMGWMDWRVRYRGAPDRVPDRVVETNVESPPPAVRIEFYGVPVRCQAAQEIDVEGHLEEDAVAGELH